MTEFNESLEAAIAKAAQGIAEAETLEEAVEWNRILSNLYYVQDKSNPQVTVNVAEPKTEVEPFFVDTETGKVETNE